MKTTCLITNYNKGDMLGEAVESALHQARPLDEVLVVDDGSTDGSAEAVEKTFKGAANFRLLRKENGGQLSSFNLGFQAASGEVVFLLDADDLFTPDHTQEMVSIYTAHHHLDFVFCGFDTFGNSAVPVQLPRVAPGDLGVTALLTLFSRKWIGKPTSCLSIRRRLLNRILPIPYEEEWRIRADDCLIWASSLAGGRKYFLAQPLTRYRVHGGNEFVGLQQDPGAREIRKRASDRFFAHYQSLFGYDDASPGSLPEEFRTHPAPDRFMLWRYLKTVSRTESRHGARLRMMAGLMAHYLAGKTAQAGLR